MRRHHIVIPLAALLAISPLLVFGTSCGHDIGFHMQSWVDAAAQLRHGTLYPRWAFSPAWQAGEPRFVFYPPLSWMHGALLTMVLPMAATPNAFVFIALVAAGFSMHRVASRFSSANAALLAACVYLANPYMFFNAFERSAYAELLASVWVPLLFLAVLRERPSVVIAAAAISLAWLTNVPAGIMATYAFVVLAAVRVVHDVRSTGATRQTRSTATLCLAGLLLGLALPAFYLLPAAVERRWVQSSMVMIENLRYQDNYLFHRTSWEPHNIVTHAISMLAVSMLIVTAGLLAVLYTGTRRTQSPEHARVRSALVVLFTVACFLMLPLSGFVWHVAPELPFLQFPWRLLTVMSAVLALALALALRRWHTRSWFAAVAALLYVAAAMGITSHLYRQACEIPHMAQFTLNAFRSGHGVPATDEYTPGDADNDLLRTDNPGYWPVPADKTDAYAPGTVPNPNEYDPYFDGPIPFQYTKAEHAPIHLELNLQTPAVLVFNLRDYPDWHIRRNGALILHHIRRDDGLLAVAVPAGLCFIDIAWHRGWAVYAGDAVSLTALAALVWLWRRSRQSPRVESTIPA